MNEPASLQQIPIVRLNNAEVRFEGQTVPTLQGISLDIAPREIVGVVGPSGCGKSTLLRVLANLLPAGKGAQSAVESSYQLAISPDELAMVFQDARLLPWRTVIGNMQLPFELSGKPVDRKRIEHLLELTGLQVEDYEKYPRMLSGGMKMRVAIARALVLEPKLLLLDEPFAAVDDLLREQLNVELLNLQKEFGFSAVLVTHHISEAVFLCDRLLIMSAVPGEILEEMKIPWGPQRDSKLRLSVEFVELCGAVKQQLQYSHEN